MEITKEMIEGILIMLYKLEECEACNSMLRVYKKYYVSDVRILH